MREEWDDKAYNRISRFRSWLLNCLTEIVECCSQKVLSKSLAGIYRRVTRLMASNLDKILIKIETVLVSMVGYFLLLACSPSLLLNSLLTVSRTFNNRSRSWLLNFVCEY